jgi:triosephosphate isomerase (TIM)
MKKILVVGNWKMHLSVAQASLLVARLNKNIKTYRDIEVVLAPPMLALQPLSLEIDRRKFRLAAQNAYQKDEGAFTGEVSFAQLHDLVHYVIIGHSERRIYGRETHEEIREKVAAAFRNRIAPILCVGETQTERQSGETRQVLHDQVVTAVANLTRAEIANMVIAYEPVWAISTFGGEIARPDDVEKEMKFIRSQLSELYGADAAKHTRIIYGGSVDEHNARAYLEINECSGLLPGSASLNYHKFAGIIQAAYKLNRDK